MSAFYTVDGDRIVPSELTRGPWEPDAQHAGPPSGLLARAIETCEPREDLQLGRVTIDILRPVPLAPLTVSARVERPGRSVELVEASLAGPQGVVMRATAWRVARADLGGEDPAGATPAALEHARPGEIEAQEFRPSTNVGYHDAIDYRFVQGHFREAGPGTVWMRMRVPLVAGEEPTPLQRVMVTADTGNGISSTLDWRRFLFINCDLTVQLVRLPRGEWLCLESVTTLGEIGVTETRLWDDQGRVGSALQTLVVRSR